MATQCLGRNKAGGPCAARVLPGSGFCQWHAPEMAAQRRAWSAQGGRNRANSQRARKSLEGEAMTTDEVLGLLSRTLRKLEAGGIEPGLGTATATVAKALISIRQSSELEDRLAELEARSGITNISDRGTA